MNLLCMPLLLLLLVFGNAVKCTDHRIIGYDGMNITRVVCWDDFGSPLNITENLPNGLYFVNNTIFGNPVGGMPLHPYYVTSKRDIQHPFTIYIGIYANPHSLFIATEDSVILKNVFIDCIPIRGNTLFSSYSIVPELPQDLYIDERRGCIGGVYTGFIYGRQDYVIEGRSEYGTIRRPVTLFYTYTTQNGLIAEYYSISNSFLDTFRYLPSIPAEAIHLEKKAVVDRLNYDSFDGTSPFYDYGLSTISTLYTVFHGTIHFPYAGYYLFRSVFESAKDRTCNQFRVRIDDDRIIDSWSIPPSYPSPFELLQSVYVDQPSTRSIQIEWISSCSKVRPFHLEWKEASYPVYSPIPSSALSHGLGNVFTYAEMTSVCRLNKYYTNRAIVDSAVIEGLLQNQNDVGLGTTISFSSDSTLPQGLAVDSHDGSISGYPTTQVTEMKVHIIMTVMTSGHEYVFENTVTLSVIERNPTPSNIIYYRNNTEVTELNITTLETILLIPKSETDYLFFTINPGLPSFLSFDSYTGRIEGKSLQCLESTHFIIQGVSAISVVNTGLTISISNDKNTTVVGGLLDGVHARLTVIENGQSVLNKEVNKKEIVGCYVGDVYEVTVQNFKNFSWATNDNLQFVVQNNVFTPCVMNRTSEYSIQGLAFSVNMTSMKRPEITISNTNYTFYTGVSIPNIPLFINQPHYPITFSPALPASVSCIPRKDGVSGYILTGFFAEENQYDYVITARNPHGSDSVHLKISVESLSSSQNQLAVIDTCSGLANVTVTYNNEIVYDRMNYFSNENVIIMKDFTHADFIVTICASSMTEYNVFLILNNRELLFSGDSPSFPSPSCSSTLFNVHDFVNVDTLWKYLISSSVLPSLWRFSDYDDSYWSRNRNQFPLSPSHILYLRMTFDFTWFDSSLILNLYVFHREGLIFYINGEEVFRANVGYSTMIEDDFTATHIYPSPRYTHFAMSSNLLRNGTNVFAAKVQLHRYSLSKVDFHIISHLIGITKLREVSPFYHVKATSDYGHANFVVNNYQNVHYTWNGKSNGSILTIEPFKAHSYINTVEVTRSVNCVPDSIEIWGIFGDIEQEGNFVFRETLLLKERLLNWEHRNTIPFNINSQYAGYRGYLVRFGTGISAADCVHIERIEFFTSKQVNCLFEGSVVNIGEMVRFGCGEGKYGVITQECLQTSSGSSWGEPASYCFSSAVQVNHKRLWITISISSVAYENKIEDVLVNVLVQLLHVKSEMIKVYFSYSKQTTEFFFYKELYVLIDDPSLLRYSLIQDFKQKEEDVVKGVLEKINKEAVVKIINVHSVENRRFLICLYYCVPIVAIVCICIIVYVLLYRYRKEKQDNVYLLS